MTCCNIHIYMRATTNNECNKTNTKMTAERNNNKKATTIPKKKKNNKNTKTTLITKQ